MKILWVGGKICQDEVELLKYLQVAQARYAQDINLKLLNTFTLEDTKQYGYFNNNKK